MAFWYEMRVFSGEPAQPGRDGAIDELDLGRGRHHDGLALQPVARPDLDDFDAAMICHGPPLPSRRGRSARRARGDSLTPAGGAG